MEIVLGMVGFPKENLCGEKRSDCEEQKQKGTDGRHTRRKLGSHRQRGRKNAKQDRSQQCQMLPRGPLKELKGVVQIEKLEKSISVASRDANKILVGCRVDGR